MNRKYLILISAVLLSGVHSYAATTEFRLSGRKDRVLPLQTRATVLQAAQESLNRKDDAFLVLVDEIKNPYVYEEEVVAEVVTATGEPQVVEQQAPIVYDNRSILKAIGTSFAQQVRGTMARGSVRYLQLQGGGALQVGASFPAKLPELEGQSFLITIQDINSDGYTLQMKDATLTLPFDALSGGATGVSLDSKP
jgi:predicted phage tail protein